VNVSEPITPEHTKILAGLPLLTDLVLVGELTVNALRALPVNNRLDELAINGTGNSEDLTPAINSLIVRFPAITKLNWGADGQTISPEAATDICLWQRIQMLTTRGDLSAPVVQALSGMPALDSLLCLGNGTLDPTHVPKLKGLKYLNVSYGKHLSGMADAVAKLPLIETLRLTMRGRSVADIQPLKQCKRLMHLTLRMGGAATPTDDFASFSAAWLLSLNRNLQTATSPTQA